MHTEPTSIVQAVSQTQDCVGIKLRPGQEELDRYLKQGNLNKGSQLSIQWPTGYGKSIGFAQVWEYAERTGLADRLLLVVANDVQRKQIQNDFASDCAAVGAPCPGGVWAFQRSASCIAATGRLQVFVCTVAQLGMSICGKGLNTLKDLMLRNGHRWVIGFDEYHHYEDESVWGDAAKSAMEYSVAAVAMSATPYRRGKDTVFAKPELVETYDKAAQEGFVKNAVAFSYDYKVTTVAGGDNEVRDYETWELLDKKWIEGIGHTYPERQHIRYSSQYVHPLVWHPVQRLIETRMEYPGRRFQMLIRAMNVDHAKCLMKQVAVLIPPSWSMDWISIDRSEADNAEVIRRFCPKKVNGVRPEPELDVLIQVNKAGEGFDSIMVTEIIDLFPCSRRARSGRAVQDKQFYGRGSRIIDGSEKVTLNVNVPTDHPLAAWNERSLHTWFDSSGKDDVEPPEKLPEAPEPPIPHPPKKKDIVLISHGRDNPHLRRFIEQGRNEGGAPWNPDTEEGFSMWVDLYNRVRAPIEEAISYQEHQAGLRSYVASAANRLGAKRARKSEEVSSAVIGRHIKSVNKEIGQLFGYRGDADVDTLEKICAWLHSQLESES